MKIVFSFVTPTRTDYRVLLDGRDVSHVYTADADAGIVEVLEPTGETVDGVVQYREGRGGRLVVRTLRGRVNVFRVVRERGEREEGAAGAAADTATACEVI